MNLFVITSFFLQVLFNAAGGSFFFFAFFFLCKLVINNGKLKHKEITVLYMIFFLT